MADFYLDDERCFVRLCAEYYKHKSLIIGVDFDDTIFDFHNQGYTYDDVVNLLRRAKAIGCYIIIITGNPNEELITSHCLANNIPYDVVNMNAPFLVDDARKIYCNIMLDDRAGLSSAFKTLRRVVEVVEAELNYVDTR